MSHVLVTGASGLLGASLCRSLAEDGHQVTGFVRNPPKSQHHKLRYVSVDFTTDQIADEFPDDVDVVIHLAQSCKFRDFPDGALDVFEVNVASTACLLDRAKQTGVRQFVYASSGGVYGSGAHAFNENATIGPPAQLGYYLGSKACGEILVQSYSAIFQVMVVRPFFIYGAGQNRSMLIPRLMDSVAAGRPIGLQGEDGIRINPVHVDDATKALVAAIASRESSIYNIAGPEVLSIRQIAEAMGIYLGRPPVFNKLDGLPNDLVADISALSRDLFVPRKKLRDCLEDIRS